MLPAGIEPDEFDGTSWVGLIPFKLDRASLFGSPPVPYLGSFVEINVRLYGVDFWGRRGVVFRSLEASRLAAVLAARASFRLPYFWSRTRMQREGRLFGYDSQRHGGGPSSMVRSRMGAPIRSGPVADFLTARWGLFTRRGAKTVWVPNEHPPWQLHAAELLDLRRRTRGGCWPARDRRSTTGFGAVLSGSDDAVRRARSRPEREVVGDTGLEPMTSSV